MVYWTIVKIMAISMAVFLGLAYSPGLLDIDPVHIDMPPPRPFIGALEPNHKLEGAEKLLRNHIMGPESVAFFKGDMYTGLHNGWIVKIKDGKTLEPIAIIGDPKCESWEEERCGRPLGMRFDKNGTLYVADGYFGLYKVNIKNGDTTPLYQSSTPIDGKRALIPNDFDISSTGDIYFSDSSNKWHLKDGMYEVLESGANGRLLHHNLKTNITRTLVDDIAFANGVQLSPDEDFLLLSETNRARIMKYHLKGERAGTMEVFIDNLPGSPDNIRSNGAGGYWVPLCVATPPTKPSAMRTLGPYEVVRKVLARVISLARSGVLFVDRLHPSVYTKVIAYKLAHMYPYVSMESTYGLILELSSSGEIIRSLHSQDGSLTYISQVSQHGNDLYMGSPWNSFIAKVPL